MDSAAVTAQAAVVQRASRQRPPHPPLPPHLGCLLRSPALVRKAEDLHNADGAGLGSVGVLVRPASALPGLWFGVVSLRLPRVAHGPEDAPATGNAAGAGRGRAARTPRLLRKAGEQPAPSCVVQQELPNCPCPTGCNLGLLQPCHAGGLLAPAGQVYLSGLTSLSDALQPFETLCANPPGTASAQAPHDASRLNTSSHLQGPRGGPAPGAGAAGRQAAGR